MSPWPLLITVAITSVQLMSYIAAWMNSTNNPARDPVTATDFWVGLTMLMLAIYAAAGKEQ